MNLGVVENIHATPHIPFKSNTTGKGSEQWTKMWAFYQFKREEFMSHYHKRSNVESTFSMIKRKFGASVRSKKPVRPDQRNPLQSSMPQPERVGSLDL